MPHFQFSAFRFDDYLADCRAEFHDIRGDGGFADCLSPISYAKSQQLARQLLASGSAGIIYPSVRRTGGTCIACFRPALVTNVQKGGRTTVAFERAGSPPIIT